MIAHADAAEHTVVIATGCGAVSAYAAGWLRSATPSWSRLVAWCGGVVILLFATAPFTERWAAATFTGHMTQHLLLLIVAPPLLVVARPIITLSLLRRTRRRSAHHRIAASWRWWSSIIVPISFLVVLFGTHLTGVYDAALRHRVIHDLEHVAYVASAVGLWSVVLAPVTTKAFARVAASFAVIGGGAVLGIVLTSANRPLVDTYVDLLGSDAALADQRRAASLMWVGGMALGLPLLMTAVWRWAANEQRTTERAEQLMNARRAADPRDPTDAGTVALESRTTT